jgi:hypothetical protein
MITSSTAPSSFTEHSCNVFKLNIDRSLEARGHATEERKAKGGKLLWCCAQKWILIFWL